jgi:hypothetical protein
MLAWILILVSSISMPTLSDINMSKTNGKVLVSGRHQLDQIILSEKWSAVADKRLAREIATDHSSLNLISRYRINEFMLIIKLNLLLLLRYEAICISLQQTLSHLSRSSLTTFDNFIHLRSWFQI